ncbi:hypothetical protein LZ30DRAFT_802321, partial [Colletotrichum cereale]
PAVSRFAELNASIESVDRCIGDASSPNLLPPKRAQMIASVSYEALTGEASVHITASSIT